MNDITPPEQQAAAQTIRELLAAYREHEDLISIGAYRRGANPTVDAAIEMRDEINRFLRQAIEEPVERRNGPRRTAQARPALPGRPQTSASPQPPPQ